MPAEKPSQFRTPIFDTVRAILKRGFRQSEVEALDDALDTALDHRSEFSPQGRVARVATGATLPRQVSQAGVALIQQFEGCAKQRSDGRVEAYPDPGTGGDPWTIGWGATGPDRFQGGRIARGTVWTQEQCDTRLDEDLVRYAKDVSRALGDAPTSQAQFDALVSFHYNTGAIGKATLTRKHKTGDFAGAAREFDRWVYAGGRVMKGLARRRTAESALYRSG